MSVTTSRSERARDPVRCLAVEVIGRAYQDAVAGWKVEWGYVADTWGRYCDVAVSNIQRAARKQREADNDGPRSTGMICEDLRQLRQRGWSAREIGEQIGVSGRAVHDWIAGRYKMSRQSRKAAEQWIQRLSAGATTVG